ncbi:MAG: GNAT family N-acetyltransferase [Myxococcota bacterium]
MCDASLAMSAFAELETPRLRLRALRPDDVDAYFAMLSDPECMRYWSGDPLTTRAQAAEVHARDVDGHASGRALTWMLETHEGAAVGRIALFHFAGENRRAELGFMMRRASWGRGYMGEALDAVVGHAFGALALHRLEADVDPDNAASLALLEKRGFAREGLFRERWWVRGEWRDSIFLARLASSTG